MKTFIKLYISISLIFIALIFSSVQITLANPGKQVLSKGMQGQEVTTLQNNLLKLGYFKHDATGYFGDVTEAAVIKFQKNHGINHNGKVDTGTYNKINKLVNKPYLKKGMSGNEVTVIQNDLKKLRHFTQNATGYFGKITETAIKNFQKQHSLNVTGTADLLTYVKIDSLLSKSNSIKIIIDPGHGGIDKGTSKGYVIESKTTLDISKRLEKYLDNAGYNTVLTRDKDIALDNLSSISGTRQQKDLDARTNIINKGKAKLFISIHVNSCPNLPSFSGSVVYYNDKIPKSKIIAQNIQKALNSISVSNFKRQTHDCQEANFYVLRNSNVPGVLVETANITNNHERQLLSTDAFKDKIARAILSGIQNTNLNY